MDGTVRRGRRALTKALGVLFLVVHAGLAPVALAIRSAAPMGPPGLFENFYVNVPKDADVERQTVVVVTAPIPILAGYLAERRALEGLSVPRHTRVLAPYDGKPIAITRPDAYTLVITPANGYMSRAFDRLAYGPVSGFGGQAERSAESRSVA